MKNNTELKLVGLGLGMVVHANVNPNVWETEVGKSLCLRAACSAKKVSGQPK